MLRIRNPPVIPAQAGIFLRLEVKRTVGTEHPAYVPKRRKIEFRSKGTPVTVITLPASDNDGRASGEGCVGGRGGPAFWAVLAAG